MWKFDAASSLLPLATLASIRSNPAHGYGIRKFLSERGFGDFKGGTIYPLLQRLEEAGLIVSQWDMPDKGAAKKIYHISEAGEQILQSELDRTERLFVLMKNF